MRFTFNAHGFTIRFGTWVHSRKCGDRITLRLIDRALAVEAYRRLS